MESISRPPRQAPPPPIRGGIYTTAKRRPKPSVYRVYIPLRKARITDSDLDPVVQAAAKLEPRLRKAFEQAVENVKGRIKLKDLEQALLSGDEMAVERVLGLREAFEEAFQGVGATADAESLRDALRATFAAGAKAAMGKLPTKTEAAVSFDLLNPRAVEFLQSYEFDLIRQIDVGTREAIRDVMERAFTEGMHPRVAARQIRQRIGLTDTQVAAVRRFQQALIEGDAASILQHELRDHRFDSTLRAQMAEGGLIGDRTPFRPEQIQRMTDRYYKRFLKHRSETIARTETIRASMAGQQELWEQAADQGLIDRQTVQRRWVTARDERVCPICGPLHGEKVALRGNFTSGNSIALHPPIHPRCRCSLVLHFPRSVAAPRPVGPQY